jgi:pimeloyl-ACP methyl ester carboxylesterase
MESITQELSSGVTLHGRRIDAVMADGVVIPMRVFGPADAKVRVVCSHGNGMAIDGYADFWSRLTDAFQVVLYDQRGHGRSDPGSYEHHSWEWFRRDMAVVLNVLNRALGRLRTVGAFHSLSSIVAVDYLREQGADLDALVLYDPPFMPPEGHPVHHQHMAEMYMLANRVATRRARFDDPGTLAAAFARQPAASRWRPNAYLDMARAVMRPSPDGQGWSLSCAPNREAKIFGSNADASLYEYLAKVRLPMLVVASDPAVENVEPSAHACRWAAQNYGLRYLCMPDSTHFLQLEQPGACAQALLDFMAEFG